jgi:mycothiol synthase
VERSDTLENIIRNYSHLTNCDPYTDMLFAEVDGQVIGYQRVFWEALEDGTRLYGLLGYLLPAWRRKGIGTAMFQHAEARLREIAATHPEPGERYFNYGVRATQVGSIALLESQGYKPTRYWIGMLRDLGEPFPAVPMPAGLEVRPVAEAHFRPIHAAMNEAFRDHWATLKFHSRSSCIRRKNPILMRRSGKSPGLGTKSPGWC